MLFLKSYFLILALEVSGTEMGGRIRLVLVVDKVRLFPELDAIDL